MFILKFKDGSNKIRHYRTNREDLLRDCEFNSITVSDFEMLESDENIIVDKLSENLYLESDYNNYINTTQYLAEQKKQLIQSAKTIRDTAINEITNAKLLDDLQLDAGIITEAVHTARKTARLAQLAEVNTTFYTTTGLTQPTTIIA